MRPHQQTSFHRVVEASPDLNQSSRSTIWGMSPDGSTRFGSDTKSGQGTYRTVDSEDKNSSISPIRPKSEQHNIKKESNEFEFAKDNKGRATSNPNLSSDQDKPKKKGN